MNRCCGDTDSICPAGPMDDIDGFSTVAPSIGCSVCSHSSGGAIGQNFDSASAIVRRNDISVVNHVSKKSLTC
jgi:hypothetical protein